MITLHLQLCFVLIHVVCQLFAVTINSVQIKDKVVPSKGSAIQLVCSISGFTSGTVASWYKTDTQDISFGTAPLVQCISNRCISGFAGYIYSADDSNMYVNITDLSQSRDGKWWTCIGSTEQKSLQLQVYTIPKSIVYEQVPTVAQDLSSNGVELKCKTDCAYPGPTFYWYYTENGASRQKYSASGHSSEETDRSCTDSEKIYSSTLTLAQYTTFTGNADKTVKLECGITSFPVLTTGLYTLESPEITFAVNVTSVALKDASNAPTSNSVITVTSGLLKTLACSPSFSRPTATIVWYIGEVEKQRSTSFTFTPSDSDHDQHIHCKAFNIPPESQAVFSERPILYVQDAPDIDAVLSPAILKENNSLFINCSVKGGRPATYRYTALEQTWRGIVIANTHSHLAGTAMYSSLNLTSLQLQDTGNYTCHVNNGVRDVSGELDQTGTAYVTIEVPPKILAQQTIFHRAQGENLNISVPFYSYPAPDKITFTKQAGDPIKNDNRYTVAHLPAHVTTQFYGTDVILDGHTAIIQIIRLEEPDFGNYTLMVTNSLGTNEHTIAIISYRRPEAPSDLQPLHDTVTESTIAVEWKPGFNGGLQQTFYIKHRKSSDAQWSSVDISEPAINVTLNGLTAGKKYVVQIYSQNSIGKSSVTGLKTFVTLALVSTPQGQAGPIIGAFVGGFFLAVLFMVVLMLIQRRYKCVGCLSRTKTKTREVDLASKRTNEIEHSNMSAIDEYENGMMLESTKSKPEISGGLYMDLNAETRVDTYDVLHGNIQVHPQGHPGNSQNDDEEYMQPGDRDDGRTNKVYLERSTYENFRNEENKTYEKIE